MSSTERRLDAHKLFATYNADGDVVIQAVTDGGPVTRIVWKGSANEARGFAADVIDAAQLVSSERAEDDETHMARIDVEWSGSSDIPGVLEAVCDLVMKILCATPGVDDPQVSGKLDAKALIY